MQGVFGLRKKKLPGKEGSTKKAEDRCQEKKCQGRQRKGVGNRCLNNVKGGGTAAGGRHRVKR